MLDKFIFPNGQKYWLSLRQGVVAENSVSSDTVVSSGPRNSQVIGGQLIYSPGAIRSKVVTTVKVWVKGDDGLEEQLDLSTAPVPVRNGHRLIAVHGAKEGTEAGPLVAAYNVTTDQMGFDPECTLRYMAEWGAGRPAFFGRKFLAKSVAACMLIGALFGGSLGAFFGIIAGVFVGLIGVFTYTVVNEKHWAKEFKQKDENARKMMLEAARAHAALKDLAPLAA